MGGWARRTDRGWRLAGVLLLVGALGSALDGGAAQGQDAQTWLQTMLARENEATAHRGRYTYLNEERSERTGGHAWVERVGETDWGKVRLLLSEDGRPLTPERVGAEYARLADEAARPEVFKQQEAARVDADQHARDMLTLLPKAFVLDPPQTDGQTVTINYHPNPSYKPQTMEQKVLHAMSGTVYLDAKEARMKEVNGHTSDDVSVGFGLASIKAGSNFDSKRAREEGPDWKLQSLHADVKGKAFFLKIARQQDSTHTEFKKIADHLTVAQVVAMVEKP